MDNQIKIESFVKDSRGKEGLTYVLQETDSDFVPALSQKFDLTKVIDKYVRLAHVIVAYVRDVPAGVVAFYPNEAPDVSYLSIIAVIDKYRGLGIGKKLEEESIRVCREYGSAGVSLNMRKGNLKLYQSRLKMGYSVTKEYLLEGSDVVIVDMNLNF